MLLYILCETDSEYPEPGTPIAVFASKAKAKAEKKRLAALSDRCSQWRWGLMTYVDDKTGCRFYPNEEATPVQKAAEAEWIAEHGPWPGNDKDGGGCSSTYIVTLALKE